MDTILCNGTSIASHTYGNIMECIRVMLLQKFPPGYFKQVHTSSSMAYRYFSRNFSNREADQMKKQKPHITFKPVFEIYDDDMFLSGTPLTTNIDNMEYGYSRSGLCKCIRDFDNNYELDYKLNRDKISYDVTIKVSTLHQQLDLYKFLQNTLSWNRPFTYRTALESMIPHTMMKYISRMVDKDITEASNVAPFLKYIQSVSNYPITYKMRNSSSRDEFFMYYRTNILVTFSELDKDDGDRKIMVEDDFAITFKVTMAFNLPGMYMVLGDSRYPITTLKESGIILSDNGEKDYISIFTLDGIYEAYPFKDEDGFRLYSNTIYKTDDDKHGKPDDFDLDVLFEEDVIKVIKQHNFTDINPGIFMKMVLMGDTTELVLGTDFNIDYGKMKLNIFKSDKDITYRLIIYMNNVYVTEKVDQNIREGSREKIFSDIK